MGFKPKKTQKNKQQFGYPTQFFFKNCEVQTHPNIRYLCVLLMGSSSHVISSRNINTAITYCHITVKDGRKITQNVLGEHKVITTAQ